MTSLIFHLFVVVLSQIVKGEYCKDICETCYEYMTFRIGLFFNKMHFTGNWVDLGCV